MREGTTRHFPVLDELRGLAALFVLVFHMECSGFRIIPHHAGLRLIPHGYLAVDFFFMLSGFVVAAAYEERLARGALLPGDFLLARVRRLYPALLAGLLLGLVAMIAGFGLEPFSPAVLLNLFVLPVFRGAGAVFPVNLAIWSLFFELAANLLHALVLPALNTRRLATLLAVSGLAMVHFAATAQGIGNVGAWGGSPFAVSFLGGFARVGWGYCLGVLVFRLVRSGTLHVPALPAGVAPLLFALALLAPMPVFLGNLLCLGMALPLVLLAGIGAERAGWSPSAAWLGVISYPLYATHIPLLVMAQRLRERGFMPDMADPLYWLAVGLVAIAFAAVVERHYEAPVRAWLGRRHRSRIAALAGA